MATPPVPSVAEIEALVLDLAQELFGLAAENPLDQTLDALGIDSLDFMDLIVACEEQIGVVGADINGDQFNGDHTLRQVASTLHRQCQPQTGAQ